MKKLISMLCCICLIISSTVIIVSADLETSGEAIAFNEYMLRGNLSGNEEDAYLIRTVKQLSTFLSMCDEGNEFIEFASQLPEDYFAEKALVVVYNVSASDTEYEITNIELTNDNYVVIVRYNEHVGLYDDLDGHFIIVEVSADDAKDVQSIMNYRTAVLPQKPIDYEDHILGSYETQGGQSGLPCYIETIDELYAFKELFKDPSGWEASYQHGFFQYTDSVQPEYFDTKAMIIIYYLSPCLNNYFDVLAVYSDETGVEIHYTKEYAFEAAATAEQPTAIIIEVAKSDIINSESITLNEIKNTAVPTPLPPSEVFGDVNGNYKVEALDYFRMKMLVFHIYDEEEYIAEFGEYMSRSDMNGDGKLTAVDYLMLKRMIFTGTTN